MHWVQVDWVRVVDWVDWVDWVRVVVHLHLRASWAWLSCPQGSFNPAAIMGHLDSNNHSTWCSWFTTLGPYRKHDTSRFAAVVEVVHGAIGLR